MGKTLKTVLGLIVLLLVVWAIVQLSSTRDVQPEVSAEPIKIGFMAPLTGDAAPYGQSERDGVLFALQELGLEDRVELIQEDSQCDPKLAVNAVNKLVNADGVIAIVGETCSSSTLAATPIAEENGVVMVSPSATSPAITDAGDFIFRTIPSDALQGAFGAQLAFDLGYERMAVLHANDDYGLGFNDVLVEAFPELGGHIVASESVERGATDMRSQLTKIKAQTPDVIYMIFNSPATASSALRQVQELEIDAQVIGSEGFASSEFTEPAGEASNNLIVTTVTTGSDDFHERYEAAYGEEPGIFAAQAYDAFYAIALAIEDGATTGEEVRDFLYALSFEGASGLIEFDENGDVSGNYDLVLHNDNEFNPTTLEELLGEDEDAEEEDSDDEETEEDEE